MNLAAVRKAQRDERLRTIAELRKLQRACARALLEAERARAARDDAVRAALADRNNLQADIMAVTGLSRGRIAQIRKGTR